MALSLRWLAPCRLGIVIRTLWNTSESMPGMTPTPRPVPTTLLILLLCSSALYSACLPASQSTGTIRVHDKGGPAAVNSIATLSLSLAQGDARSENSQFHPTFSVNLTPNASGLAYKNDSDGRQAVDDQAYLALDDDTETIWSSSRPAPQWYAIALDQLYLVNRIEMVVTQSPPGPTTHELWVGNGSGVRTRFRTLSNSRTVDGQTLTVEARPPLLADELLILTTRSPSWVAWREIRVFGSEPPVSHSQHETPPLEVRKAVAGLKFPVQATHAGDGSGRIFVVEQHGRILTVENGKLSVQPFLDISERVSCCQERGMFNVAFSPTYASDRTLYVSYTNLDGDTVISRFSATGNPEKVEPGSEKSLLVIPQPGPIHNGGQLAFGPLDGFLYIGSGDGGHWHQDTAQNPGSLLGKILRIDVSGTQQPYGVPDTNPYSSEDDHRDEIWALGLRNPWGFAFDKKTGDLFIPDTGNTKREEVNFQPASSQGGENYGWLLREGTICFELWHCAMVDTDLRSPVAEYDRPQGCAIVGGVVYRNSGSRKLQGQFLFADFCSGRIWGLRKPQPLFDKMWQPQLVAKADVPISSVGEDEEGKVYVTGYQDGVLYLLAER